MIHSLDCGISKLYHSGFGVDAFCLTGVSFFAASAS